jgi:hypothetical protein
VRTLFLSPPQRLSVRARRWQIQLLRCLSSASLTPLFLSQGALCLSNLLTHSSVLSASHSSSSRIEAVNRALTLYSTSHQPRAQKVSTTSYEAGLLYEFLGKEGRDFEAIRKNLEGDGGEGTKGRMEWIWEYPLEEEIGKMVTGLAQA